MKVLLINPTRSGFDSYISPPLHLIYIAGSVQRAGHQAQIIDVHYQLAKQVKSQEDKQKFLAQKIEEIISHDFDVLGVGSIVSSWGFVKDLVNALKERKPNIPIIVGGGMSMALKELWAQRTAVDFLVESDGELVIQQFLQAYPDLEKLAKIPGLHIRKDKTFFASKPYLPRNLDYISFPQWEYLDNLQEYLQIQKRWINVTLPQHLRLGANDTVMPIVMTRGCPYQCTFCYHVNNLHRSHSVDYVVRYLKHIKEKYHVNFVSTWDELIMADRKWLEDLSDEIAAQKLNIKIFTSGGKPNLVKQETLRKMKKAGFVRISYGIETGSQTMLGIMKKKTTVQQNFDAVTMSFSEGIFTHINMVLGMPGETTKTLGETARFLSLLAKKGVASSHNISFSYATGYPGTELYDYMIEHNIVGDTEKYLKEQTGVGDYKFNLCGLPVRLLRFYKHWMLIKADRYFYLQRKEYKKAIKYLFRGIAKLVLEVFMPASARRFILKLVTFKRLGV